MGVRTPRTPLPPDPPVHVQVQEFVRNVSKHLLKFFEIVTDIDKLQRSSKILDMFKNVSNWFQTKKTCRLMWKTPKMSEECFKEMATINKQICKNSNSPHSPLNQTLVGLHHKPSLKERTYISFFYNNITASDNAYIYDILLFWFAKLPWSQLLLFNTCT